MITAMQAVSILVWLAQAPPAGAATRYQITLELHGVWGLVTDQTGTCPGVPPGFDRFTGNVARVSDDEDGVQYSGVLARSTDIGLCEVKDTADATRWCSGHLSGRGPFRVTIKVPQAGNDSEQTGIEFEPDQIMAVSVSVNGACDTLDNAKLASEYRSHDAIYFETSDAPGQLMATGGLSRGTFLQTRHSTAGDLGGYALTVQPIP